MLSPKDEALAREESILLEEQIDKSLFNTKETPGARREALLYPAINVTNYDKGHQKLQLCFTLPPGAYATIVLREFLKND
ncbi:MAG: hypothetical protein A2451_09940 [Bdellovibrionales bacterium RIFOXYC2_FULL_39_8]|nr:MAG: hypothetical protein A2451_09940 [Bdellovibrionales bacterium RIFOXYC2_FULL_39_8]